jgi:PAS domain S-box-containing protein
MWLIFLCPIIVTTIGFIIICGWFIHSFSPFTLIAHFEPMQFNTALCFIFCSTAFIIGLTGKHNVLRISLLVATLVIAFFTLMQYPLKIQIDTLFIKPFLGKNISIAKMAPITALAFIFSSLSLISLNSNFRLPRYKALIISLFASFSFALGLVPILGYLTRIETAYTWGTFSTIPPESATCFVLLSIATISYVWARSETESIWLPIPVFIAFITVALFMSTAVYYKELNGFKQILESNAENAATLTEQTLENFIQALNRMANRWEVMKNSSSSWHSDAQAYIQDFPYLIALEILNKDLTIEDVESTKNFSFLIGKKLNDDDPRKRAIDTALKTHRLALSDVITLKEGGSGFLCFIPLYTSNHEFSGMLVGVLRTQDFFNSVFTKVHFPSSYITVYEHGFPIFSNLAQQNDKILPFKYYTTIHYKNISWVLTLIPNLDAFANRVSPSYLIVFGFGLLMTLLVTLCSYLILKSHEKSKALIDSETRYRMILDGIKDYAIFMLTPSGNVKSWNIGAQRLKGYTDKEILGKPFSIFYTAEDIAKKVPETSLNIAKIKSRYEGESIKVRNDGSTFWAKTLIEPLYDPEERLVGFVNITRNITDTREMEMDRSKLISLIEESSDFVGIADLDGNLQYHNPSARLMVGLPYDYDMSRMKISDMHPEWAAKQALEVAIPAVYEKGIWTGETALLHRDGQEIPVLQALNLHRDAMGEPVCFTTIMRDITELKAAEEATKASEETFRSAMQYASIATALVSSEGKWLKVNAALCDMLGYTEEELQTTDFQSLTHPDDLAEDLENMERMLNKQTDKYQMEKRYFHKDGHIIWGLLDVTMLSDADGAPKFFISQIQDITGRKKAEAANKQLMEALAKSNAELERFAYVASHDLQEPIRMINNFGEMLLTEKQNELDPEAKEYLMIMTGAGVRMHDVINDLLAYSRAGKEMTQFVDFNGEEIFKSTLENIKTLIEEQKAEVTHEPLPILHGNPMQIMRLFQNLIANAIKYQSEGNKPIIHIGVKDKGNSWCISIQDNGIGIEEQFIEEIFEPFRRLHTWESIRGSGLGLSICKKIAEIHQGTLTVTSVVGKGSVFYLTLPKF